MSTLRHVRNLECPGIQCSINVSVIIILRLAGFYLVQWLSNVLLNK